MILNDGPDEIEEQTDGDDDEWDAGHLDGLRAAGLPVRASELSPRPALVGLQPSTIELLEASHADSTRRAYEASWADYCAWCYAAGLRDPYSTTAVDVANWVSSHVSQGLSVSYLRRRLAAITWAFDTVGLPAPSRLPIVRRAVAGAARETHQAPVRAAPLLLADLRHLVNGMAIIAGRPHNDPAVRRDRALLLVGWYAALRSADLTGIDVEDLHFKGDPDRGNGGLLIRLRDPKRRGGTAEEWVAVPFTNTIGTCPVRAVMLLARQHRTGPVFRRLDRRAHQAVSSSRLDPKSVTEILRRRLTAASVDAEPYSSHSLRAGWVTEARHRGIPADQIMRHTRHVDARMLHVYDRPTDLLGTPVAHEMGEW